MDIATFTYLMSGIFSVSVIVYGAMGIKRRKISWGLRGSLAHKHQIVLTGNYAIFCSIGLIIGGLLVGLANVLRFNFDLTDATIAILEVASVVILFASCILTTIFQAAVDIGRELGGQSLREK